MNFKVLGKFLGLVMLIESAILLFPMLVAIIYRESVFPFLITIGILLILALPTRLLKPKNNRIYAKEGFVCVALSWIILSLFGALPFVLSGSIPNYIDAFFETVSGFTTTGSSILTDIETLPRGILFWRSFTHWIGGMGILVFMLAILPNSDGNVIHIMRAETPGPQKSKLVPKLRNSSILLYAIYLAITVAEVIALLCTGMPLYDSLITSFGTTGTGGFSVLNSSIAGYNNPAAEWIIAVFLLLSGINYNIYFFALIKKFRDIGKNEEIRAYLLIILASTTLIAINLWSSISSNALLSEALNLDTVGECIRAAFFQVTSIISTAGFTTLSFNALPEFTKAILIILMLIGACASSTAGGLKISRLIIVLKTMRRNLRKMLKPNAVQPLRLDGGTLDENTANASTNYLAFYTVILFAMFLLISVDGKTVETNITATISCFNNIGPIFGYAGANGSFADFSYFSKIILSIGMLFGRLEIMPMLILFSPSTWRKN